MPSRFVFSVSLITTLLVAIGVIGLNSYYQNIEPATVAEASATGVVDLELTHLGAHLIPEEETTLTLELSTQAHATAAQIELTYNPKELEIIALNPGDFLPVSLVAPQLTPDRLFFVLAAPPDSGGKTGTGTLATLQVKPLTTGPLSLGVSQAYLTAIKDGEPLPGNSLRSFTLPPLLAHRPGDFVPDGQINLADYNYFVAGYLSQQAGGPAAADLTLDQAIDIADYNAFVASYDQ